MALCRFGLAFEIYKIKRSYCGYLLFYSISRSPSCTPQFHRSSLSALELWWSPGCDTVPQQCGVFHGRTWPWWRILLGWRHGYTSCDIWGCNRDSTWQQCFWYCVCVWGQNGTEREWPSSKSSFFLSPKLQIIRLKRPGRWFSWWKQRFYFKSHFNLFSFSFTSAGALRGKGWTAWTILNQHFFFSYLCGLNNVQALMQRRRMKSLAHVERFLWATFVYLLNLLLQCLGY